MSDDVKKLAMEYWDTFSDEEKSKVIRKMSNRSTKDVEWQSFLRDRPIDELLRLSEMAVPLSDEPLDIDGRFTFKNFANDPEAGLAYLKKENPSIAHTLRWRDGQVVGMMPGEDFERPLDEPGASLQDVTDVAYDVGAGVATGVASVAPSLAGPGGVFGPVAGGAMAGATEALRQQIGMMAGIDQSVDWGDIGTHALVGGIPTAVGLGGKALINTVKAPVKKYGPRLVGSTVRQGTSNPAVPHRVSGYLGDKAEAATRKLLHPNAGGQMSKEPIMRAYAAEQAPALRQAATGSPIWQSIIHGAYNPYANMLQAPSSTGGGVSPLMK